MRGGRRVEKKSEKKGRKTLHNKHPLPNFICYAGKEGLGKKGKADVPAMPDKSFLDGTDYGPVLRGVRHNWMVVKDRHFTAKC